MLRARPLPAGGLFYLTAMWIEFTADHVKSRLSSRELQTYENTASANYADDSGDPSPPSPPRIEAIIEQVCNRFRGAIRANPHVATMGPYGTLPDFCIYDAATLAKSAMITLNPVPEGMTDPRQAEIRAAEKMLESLRTGPAAMFAEDDLPTAVTTTATSYGGETILDF